MLNRLLNKNRYRFSVGVFLTVLGLLGGFVLVVLAASPHYMLIPGHPVLEPPANAHTGCITGTVSITYDEAIDSTTVSTETFAVYAMQTGLLTRRIGVREGAIGLTPTLPFKPGELVQVSATTGNLSLLDGTGPVSPTVWHFRTAVGPSGGRFSDSGQDLGNSASDGVVLADLDGDGDLDAFIVNGINDNQPDKVWLNDGAGNFTDSGQNLGNSDSESLALGDIDRDGDLDAFVGIEGPNKVWLNDGAGDFTDSGQDLGNSVSYAVALGDVDGDGDLDAFVGNWEGQPNKVWLNGGAGDFSDSGQDLGSGFSYAVALGDMDGDGDLDAFVADDGGNDVWINGGKGDFTWIGHSLGSSMSFGVSLGDLDGDGDLDAFVGNSGDANRVWLNDGLGNLVNSGQGLGNSNSYGVILGDVDGDGDLDAFVGNRGGANKVWLNSGKGVFADSGQNLGNSNSEAVDLGDIDGDGDLDAIVANCWGDQANTIWVNGYSPKTIHLDAFEAANDGAAGPVSSSSVLNEGEWYRITISGTFSFWYASEWMSVCKGVPEDWPQIPSPGITNGKVGLDPAYRFAIPEGQPACDRSDNPPYVNSGIEISLDGGVSWSALVPVHPTYEASHIYTYFVQGNGAPAQFRLQDDPTDDNYGVLSIRVEESMPVLDLPVSYSNFVQAVQGNVGGKGPGRVNSWFDHTYPTYDYPPNAGTNNLTRWDGSVFDFNRSPSRIGESWYDGHNGIDLSQSYAGESVFAAAAGTIDDANTGWGCLGWHVTIDHSNGYKTIYGHLRDKPTVTGQVNAGDRIGTIGTTYQAPCRSTGPHLHFEVQFNGGPVDPYGWSGLGTDPWEIPSHWLWKYPIWTHSTVDSSGARASSPSGNTDVTIPAGALTSTITLELWDTPPVAAPSAQLRSIGSSFWLRVLQWLTGGGVSLNPAATGIRFSQSITVAATYSETNLVHLNLSQLTMYRWDEDSTTWKALTTTLDVSEHQAVAQTAEIGHFDLQAPLLCPSDDLEPDDNYDAAPAVATDGTPVIRLFDIAQDEDWSRVETVAGGRYAIHTRNLAAGVDTLVEVYDLDGSTLLASDDNNGQGAASMLEWRAPRDGTYFIRVVPASSSAYGCDAAYELSVSQLPPTINKTVIPEGEVDFGEELTYTLVISATPGTQLGLYDPLEDTTFVGFVEQPDGVGHVGALDGTVYLGGVITGTLEVTPTNQVTVSFVTKVGVPGTVGQMADVLNRACIFPLGGTLGTCTWSNVATNRALRPYEVYLPLAVRDSL